MKTKLPSLLLRGMLLLSAGCGALASAVAAPLTATSAVHLKPDAGSATITFLKAGTEPTPARQQLATTPAGWLAVELNGPFEGYVPNKDILKSLDIRTGASIFLAPKADAAAFTTVEAGDKAEITGLRGKWTQVRVTKKLIGYIHLGAVTFAHAAPPPSNTPKAAPGPVAPPPVPATAYGVTTAGKPAPVVGLSDSAGVALPRLFQGKFVSTKSAFKPRRPYDWALNDDAGTRYAYLDISKLLLTDQIENYVDHTVVAYGAAKPVPGSKDIVIEVESLQLK
jgi:hypothetical protein